MRLKKLELHELKAVYDREITEAFPPAERKPYAAMEQLMKIGRYLPYGALDEADTLVGYAMVWSSLPGTYVMLDYLGVTKPRRNRGLGGQILELLCREFRGWEGIIVESEAPDGGQEDELRRRRLGFYARAGCTLLPHDAWLFGVHYRTLLLDAAAAGADPARALEAHRELYHNYLTQEQLCSFVRLPFDPERDAPPAFEWEEVLRLFEER